MFLVGKRYKRIISTYITHSSNTSSAWVWLKEMHLLLVTNWQQYTFLFYRAIMAWTSVECFLCLHIQAKGTETSNRCEILMLVFFCSSVPVVLFDTPGISRCRSQHVSVESSSLLHHSIYLRFICFTWWSNDELENLHADRTTVCFEPW